MSACLVVGVGNPLRRDDGVGPRAALALAAEGWPARALHQPVPELALELAGVDRAVFLDADRRVPPGAIEVRRITPRTRALASHALDFEDVLALAEALGGRAPAAWVVSIGAADFAIGEGLSAPLEAAFEAVLARVRSLLDARPERAEDRVVVPDEVSRDA